MVAPHILARTLKEAHAFAREELGLERGRYRVVTSPSSISSVRGADLYLVPGWQNRHDRFAMKGALRWTRLNKVDVAEMQAEEPAITDDLNPPGEQLTLISDEEAHAFIADDGPEVAPDVVEQGHSDLSSNDDKPKTRRRRRRCKECGILVEPDEVESHAKDHETDLIGSQS